MKFIRLTLALFLTFSLLGPARALQLPDGLSIDVPAAVDLTYQIIPSFDKEKKVMAGWDGDKLQYFISLEKLPPGWVDAKTYFAGLMRELSADGTTVTAGERGAYKTGSGLRGDYILLSQKRDPKSEPTAMVVHFITDGKTTFIAFASVVDVLKTGAVIAQTTTLFKTAALDIKAMPAKAQRSNETPFFGTWISEEAAADGKPISSKVVLKDDLSFLAEVSYAGATVFKAAGAWSVQDDTFLWTYTSSQPVLPVEKRRDEDRILSIDTDRFVTRSPGTGKEHVFVRSK